MANYSKEEIEEFKCKDLRICRTAMIKSILESQKGDANEVLKNCQIAEQYVEFIYNGLPCKKEQKQEIKSNKQEIDWQEEAQLMGVPAPTVQNIKVLTAVKAEFKKLNDGVEICPNHLLDTIYKQFGKYPTSMNSVETILKTLEKN